MSLDERNEELNRKINDTDLPNAVATLVVDARKRKKQLRLLAISIFLDLLLTVGLGFVSVQTHEIAVKAESNQQSLMRSCEATNEARANNKVLWDHVFELTTSQTRTPDEQAEMDNFKGFVQKTFAPRDCSALMK